MFSFRVVVKRDRASHQSEPKREPKQIEYQCLVNLKDIPNTWPELLPKKIENSEIQNPSKDLEK